MMEPGIDFDDLCGDAFTDAIEYGLVGYCDFSQHHAWSINIHSHPKRDGSGECVDVCAECAEDFAADLDALLASGASDQELVPPIAARPQMDGTVMAPYFEAQLQRHPEAA